MLRDVHLFLSSQTEVLSPPSRPSSPASDHRVQKLKETVQEAFNFAGGEPACGEWVNLSEKLRMGCVRGNYRRMGTMMELQHQNGRQEEVQWVLPDDEEAWFKWERAREESKTKGRTTESQSPKEITHTTSMPEKVPRSVREESQPSAVQLGVPVSPRTLQHVTDKVTRWKASMSSDSIPAGDDLSPAAIIGGEVSTVPKGKEMARGSRESSSLGFPVVKRAIATAAGKKGKGPPGRPAFTKSQANIDAVLHKKRTNDPADREGTAAGPSGGIDMASTSVPLNTSLASDDVPKITEFPEAPYLPPSFPPQLETSTPQPLREKPPPILPNAPSSSSPSASACVDSPVSDHRHKGNDRKHNASSSLPLPITPRQPVKRARSVASPADPAAVPHLSPPAKRPRTDLPHGDIPSSSTPSPATPAREPEPVPEVTNKQALGNAEGGILTTTPHRNLPTLDELLASSRRSKPRPRPPSRKLPFVKDSETAKAATLPRPHTPIREENPSPTKSYFSSPASPTESPGSPRAAVLRSPVSPMFSFAQNPNAFLPQYTSTQQPLARGGGSMGRTGSGFFAMGYNSQFDVEGQVDRVSELLEKDVDFDGWLRDIPASGSLEQLEASKDD
ncbi:hypothetical protein BV22DRAFT_1196198 [Leucogyrophana mollusca]|uniref:Uncharacterized protein n=1 Tax=Leucogyrophana mollusca TaxID=85980 RepID=A0ACB8BEH8_9AGAM|nr:hypothetical protein BV22DRAFT_1196198 [Leucogyrophana mollusca]